MMTGKASIYLTNNTLIIYRWYGKKLVEELRLKHPEHSLEKLQDYILTHGNKPIKVVIDIMEEMYALESLPHLNQRDRLSMIQRKQKQLFTGLNFIYSQYKGRSDTERRDDLVLFAAITEEKAVTRWLQVLFEAKIRVAGLYSLPVLMESFTKQLQGKQYKLLISASKNEEGIFLRQSFFNNNILALSRFKQINELDQQKLAEEIKEDVNRSERFIARHFTMANTDNLSAYFFAPGNTGQTLFESIDFSSIRMAPSLVLTNDFAQAQGYEVASNCNLPAYISSMTTKNWRLPTHYKEARSAFYYTHFLLKNALNTSSFVIFIIFLTYSLLGLSTISNLHEQVDSLRVQRNDILQKLATIQAPPLFKGLNPFQLAEQIQVKQQLKKTLLRPDNVLSAISQALEISPKILLNKVKWGLESSQEDQQQMIDYTDPMTMTDDPIDISLNPALPITLEASVSGFDGNYRQVLALIEQFRMRLSEKPNIEKVTATKLPIDISSNNEISGAIKSQEKNARFILEMQWQRK